MESPDSTYIGKFSGNRDYIHGDDESTRDESLAALNLSNPLANGLIDANTYGWPIYSDREDHDCGLC
jgi:hypothetical protein